MSSPNSLKPLENSEVKWKHTVKFKGPPIEILSDGDTTESTEETVAFLAVMEHFLSLCLLPRCCSWILNNCHGLCVETWPGHHPGVLFGEEVEL